MSTEHGIDSCQVKSSWKMWFRVSPGSYLIGGLAWLLYKCFAVKRAVYDTFATERSLGTVRKGQGYLIYTGWPGCSTNVLQFNRLSVIPLQLKDLSELFEMGRATS